MPVVKDNSMKLSQLIQNLINVKAFIMTCRAPEVPKSLIISTEYQMHAETRYLIRCG